MHGAGREDHRHGCARRRNAAIVEDDLAASFTNCVLGFHPDALEHIAKGPPAALDLIGAIDRGGALAEMFLECQKLGIEDDRLFQLQDLGLAWRLVVDIAEIAEPGLQAHDPIFAQRVDRRIGHLAELLAEEVMQPAIAPGQHRHRRIVAHGSERLLGVQHHRRQDQLQILHGDAEEVLKALQLVPLERDRLEGAPRHLVFKMSDPLDPLAIGLVVGEVILQLMVVIEDAVPKVDADHLARPHPALLDDGVPGERHHAGLGADDQQVIFSPAITKGPQPIAVHAADHPVAVAGDDARRTVPGLHHAIAVVEEIPVRLRHGDLAGPGRRDQKRLGERQGTPGLHQRFDHPIEGGAVRRTRLDDRLDVLVVVAKRRREHPRLVAFHPVEIASERIDFAVVGEHAEWLGELPGRPGVGGIALVKHREVGGEALVQEVRVEDRELLCEKQALIDEGAAGERADIEVVQVLGEHLTLDPPPDDEKITLERIVGIPTGLTSTIQTALAARAAPAVGAAPSVRVGDHDLLDLGPGGDRLFADDGGVHRHLAPAENAVAKAQDLGLDDGATALLCREVGARQEDHADRNRPPRFLGAMGLLQEEVLGDRQIDAGAVAGLAVGVDGAAMPDRLQCIDRRDHDIAPGLAIDSRDEPDAASVTLVGGRVHARAFEVCCILQIIPVGLLSIECRCAGICHVHDLVGHALSSNGRIRRPRPPTAPVPFPILTASEPPCPGYSREFQARRPARPSRPRPPAMRRARCRRRQKRPPSASSSYPSRSSPCPSG